LFWGTPFENAKDAIEKGRMRGRLGQNKVDQIRELYKTGLSFAEIGRIFGVHRASIHDIIKRISWRT
jgi:DNA invertase Pin-like site-specific DNA recombinase